MIAITREVSSTIVRCELTHLEREPIDLVAAREQHTRYEVALGEAGITVIHAPSRDDLPDAVFVEDTCVVLDELAVMTRPGAGRRREEVASMGELLSRYRPLASIEPPATLDGGDVLVLGRDVFVGLTARSSLSGVNQLREILSTSGYSVRGVPVEGCLHLKSAVTRAGTDTLVINPAWVDPANFPGWRVIAVDPSEPHAANVLWLGDVTIVAEAFRRTNARLTSAETRIVEVPASELAKAEGGVTCCSVLIA